MIMDQFRNRMKKSPVTQRAMMRTKVIREDLAMQIDLLTELRDAVATGEIRVGQMITTWRGHQVVYWTQPQRISARWCNLLNRIKPLGG